MSPYSNFSLSSKRSEVICPERRKENAFFLSHHCVWRPIATQPPRRSPWTLYRLKGDFVGYIFAADSMRLSSFKFSWRAPKDARSTSEVDDFRAIWKGLCDFILVINSNLSSISHRFWDRTTYLLKIANFPYPTSVQAQIWKCSLCTRSLKFGARRAKTLG